MTLCRFTGFLFLLGVFSQHSIAADVIARDSIRVNFVLPFSLNLGAQSGFFEVRGCAHSEGKEKNCDNLIAVIPLSEVRTQSELKTKFQSDGTLLLWQELPEAKKNQSESASYDKNSSIVWARQAIGQEWYEPVELCTWPDAPTACWYRVERDASTHTLELKVYWSK